ncbi:MAG: glycine cleavage system protein GcvH [Lachnospiraceae bacterium]|nr:glycine cleavage system protein GcvH [Lachnospiraceae bacterium]
MAVPGNLKYTKTHEWVEELDDGVFRIGITDFAQNELGDLVYVSLPEEGDEVTAQESFADVESVKAASEVYSPVTGIVSARNDELEDSPEKINEDPYGAWFIEVKDVTETEELLTAAEYEDFLSENA